jgi:hypothetical protein
MQRMDITKSLPWPGRPLDASAATEEVQVRLDIIAARRDSGATADLLASLRAYYENVARRYSDLIAGRRADDDSIDVAFGLTPVPDSLRDVISPASVPTNMERGIVRLLSRR